RIRKSASPSRDNGRTRVVGELASAVAGVRISHPDRLIYPDLGISKIQLAQYYERIAEWIVPHVAARPLTLVHCPAGIAAPCHYLKHAKAWGPNALRRVRIQEKTKVGEYLVADSIEAVVSLAQMGIVEIHTWNSPAADVDRPNRLVWDLDPGPLVSWKQVVKAAALVRDVLKTLNLRSWVKTTGGRGVHVVSPSNANEPSPKPGLLSRRKRGHREDGSAHLHNSVSKGGTRTTNPNRLSEEQPYEYIGLCLLATG